MRKVINLFFITIIGLFFLNGCSSSHAKEDIFQFKGSYVGDNSAVVNIVNLLPGHEHFEEMKLETTEKPYGIVLDYEGAQTEEKELKETAIYNAASLFALVQNAEWITFTFNDQEYHVTKAKLQEWYGQELSNISSESELRELTQEYMEDPTTKY